MGEIIKRRSQKDLRESGKFSNITLKEFMRPMAELCAAYPRQELGKATVEKYYDRLHKFNIDILSRAVNLAIDRCKFFPTIAEIIQIIASDNVPKNGFWSEPRPGKEETKAILESLHEAIRQFEGFDTDAAKKKIANRKALLREQAKKLGVDVK